MKPKIDLPITLTNTTKHFEGNGRALGYATANITAQTDATDGVYFGFADLASYHHHPALIFVGIPVTMGASERRVEAHLLDINDVDYYDQTLVVHLEYFHRANQKLSGIDELTSRMQRDEATARTWFAAHTE